MQIKDIVNRDLAGLATCESEPIHIPGSIQPNGLLVAIRKKDHVIEYCSANSVAFLGATPEQLLTRNFGEIAGAAWPAILDRLTGTTREIPFIIQPGTQALELSSYETNELFVIELEPASPAAINGQHVFEQTKHFVSNIEGSRSLHQLCQNIADQTRESTGYDRVMIYRFDKNYNGEVYAESRNTELEPFLSLHYPASDIPAQARELYVRNLVRMIADVSYQPVPILTIGERSSATVDLSDSQLRSVSPIHIQYLKNMKVGATLTVSLLKDGKLWGLIACHHREPKSLSFSERQAVLLQGHFLTSQIRVQEVAEEYEVNVVVEAHLQQLLNKVGNDEDFSQKFQQFTSLLALANASGAVIMHKGELFEKGIVPPRDKTLLLIEWLSENIRSMQFTTACLSNRYPEAVAISRYASGIIFHSLGKPTENCVIWFREEIEKTVNWAGNPNKAVKMDAETKMLTPRASFATWKEKVSNQSRDWRVSEVNAASRFASALQNQFHLDYLQQEEFNLRVLNDKLQKANQELSNINWITSHDLKEPLRKIQLFATKIIDKEDQELSDQIRDSVAKIHKSANRMQNLVDDILSYSLASDKNKNFEQVDPTLILKEVCDTLTEEIADLNGKVVWRDLPPVIKAIPFQLRQLFTNLVGNALKFARAGEPPLVTITAQKVRGSDADDAVLEPGLQFYRFDVQDNGIGFDDKYSQRLFDIFYRLHTAAAYKGTGIGLAICKKIVEHHGGSILAKNVAGVGAMFRIYLPA